MKKTLFALLIFFLAAGVCVAATKYSISSGEQTADAAIYARPCLLNSLLVVTDGTNDAKVILYDNASAASGTVLAEITVTGADNYGGRVWFPAVSCNNGIYADVTGTGASYIVEYQEQ